MKILEIDEDLYNDQMSVETLCHILARERPDLMRGWGWNVLRGLFSSLHWKYLLGAATAGAVFPIEPTLAGMLGAGVVTAANLEQHSYLGNKFDIVPDAQTFGAARRAINREHARHYLGHDPGMTLH